MTHSPFVHRLLGRHSLLETALLEERKRPAPDEARLALIKKRKLQVKDRLHALGTASAAPAAT